VIKIGREAVCDLSVKLQNIPQKIEGSVSDGTMLRCFLYSLFDIILGPQEALRFHGHASKTPVPSHFLYQFIIRSINKPHNLSKPQQH
jgi:hypothetical protein